MARKQNKLGVSRRDFLKGASLAAAAAGGNVPVVRMAGATGGAIVRTDATPELGVTDPLTYGAVVSLKF